MTPLEQLVAIATTVGATIVDAPGATVIVVPKGRPADGAELVTLAEAARIAATSIRTVREATRAGQLPAFGRQRDRSVRRSDLDIWLESRRVKPTRGPDDEDLARRMRRLERAGTDCKARPRRTGVR